MATKVKSVLKLERSDVLALMLDLGLLKDLPGGKTAEQVTDQWDTDRWAKKFRVLSKIVDDETKPQSKATKATLDAILDAVDAKAEIQVCVNGATPDASSNGHVETLTEPEPIVQPEYKTAKIVLLTVKDLIAANYNPAHRTDEKATKAFAKQLLSDGRVLIPILVQSDEKTIIEGHRRTAASAFLEWEKIPAIIVTDSDKTPEQIYASVNSTAKKMGGSDALDVWLKNPEAVPEKLGKSMTTIREAIGKPMMAKLLKMGLSARTYGTAKRVASYCNVADDPEMVKKILNWMISFEGGVGKTMRALAEGQSKQSLLKRINEDKPLIFKIEE